MNNKGRQLGPVIGATLVTTDLELVIKGYSQCLSFNLVYKGQIDKQQALAWQTPRLENNRYAILASSDQTRLKIKTLKSLSLYITMAGCH